MSTLTVSSTAGLLAALKSAQPGDTIALTPGAYAGVNIQNANFSGTVTVTSADPSHPAVFAGFNIAGSSGLTFSNLDFSTTGVTTPAAFRVSSSQNLTFTNLNVYGSAASWNTVEGFLIRGSSNVTVSNSNFSQLWNGIAEMENTGVDISNNSFQLITGDGIDNASSQNVAIVGNSFTNFQPNGTEHPDAIQFWTSGTTVPSENIVIENNTIVRGAGALIQGIFISDQTGVTPYQNVTISGNTITGEMYNGITVAGATGVTITDNDVTAYTDEQSWIYLNGVANASVTNNSSDYYRYTNVTGLLTSNDLITASAPIPPTSGDATLTINASTASTGVGQAGAIAGVSLSELGATTSETFTVTLSDAKGVLAATGAGVSGSGTSITVTGSLGQVNADLATLTDSEPVAGADTIYVTAADSLGNSATPVNVAVATSGLPVIVAPASGVGAPGGADAITGVGLTETGAAANETFTVTLSDSSGVLSATGAGVSGSGTSITITGSLSQVNASLATLTVIEPVAGSDTITVKAADGFANAGASASISITTNAPPVIAAPASSALTQGVKGAISGISLSEAGNTASETFSVTLSDTNGTFSALSSSTGARVTGAGSTRLTIAGSLTQVNADLATVTLNEGSSGADTITVAATDSLGGSAAPVDILVTTSTATSSNNHGHSKSGRSTSQFISSMSTLAVSGPSTQTSGGLATGASTNLSTPRSSYA